MRLGARVMFKKGSSLKRIWSRKKDKRKQKTKPSPSDQSAESPPFQEILYFVPNNKQEDNEDKMKEVRSSLEISFNEQLDGIRKREASTTQRLNAKITAITKQRDELRERLLSTEKKYRSLKKKFLDEVSGSLNRSDGCLQKAESNMEQKSHYSAKKEDSVLDSKSKISSEESSASSNESQPKKTREDSGHTRSETVAPRRDWKPESSPEDDDASGKDMDKDGLQGWIRDTNRTVHDMQICIAEIKTEIFSFSEKFEKILKTREKEAHSGESLGTRSTEDINDVKQESKDDNNQEQLLVAQEKTKDPSNLLILSKLESVCRIHEDTCRIKKLLSSTVHEVNSFLNSCKCSCYSIDTRETAESSGYVSEAGSSGMGSITRWDKGLEGQCSPPCRKVGDWGLYCGNDFVNRHIVTSSPVIATLRDLKPEEI